MPTSTPLPIPAATASATLPVASITSAPTTPDRATMAPADRSKPPVKITIDAPTVTTARIDTWFSTLTMLVAER